MTQPDEDKVLRRAAEAQLHGTKPAEPAAPDVPRQMHELQYTVKSTVANYPVSLNFDCAQFAQFLER